MMHTTYTTQYTNVASLGGWVQKGYDYQQQSIYIKNIGEFKKKKLSKLSALK